MNCIFGICTTDAHHGAEQFGRAQRRKEGKATENGQLRTPSLRGSTLPGSNYHPILKDALATTPRVSYMKK